MKSILLISTDGQLLSSLSKSLSPHYHTHQLTDAGVSLQTVSQLKPDILIIDFILDDDNAAEICHKVKSEEEMHELPIIVLSDMPGMERLALKFGGCAVVKKPVDFGELMNAVENALQKHVKV